MAARTGERLQVVRTWLARLGTLPSGPMTKLDWEPSRWMSLEEIWLPFSPAKVVACEMPTWPPPVPLVAPLVLYWDCEDTLCVSCSPLLHVCCAVPET